MIFNLFKRNSNSSSKTLLNKSNRYEEAAKLLKQRREELGVDINQLSRVTKISPNVIKAIENGLIDELPERAYMTSMIILLEEKLILKKGSLNSLIIERQKPIKDKIITIYNPGSINIFQSWHGNIIYIILLIISIIAINNQQLYLNNLNNKEIEVFKNTINQINKRINTP
tara:strand:+ start:266 stop:778 length:513 start_codon:yes stop_codon:yes gene_type:complete